MKQKDVALIAVVAVVSVVISLVIANKLIASPKNRQQSVQVVQSITSNFPLPDSKYFNSSSVNPTRLITIGPSNNPAPFSSSQ